MPSPAVKEKSSASATTAKSAALLRRLGPGLITGFIETNGVVCKPVQLPREHLSDATESARVLLTRNDLWCDVHNV